MQPKTDPMAPAGRLALPNKAILGDADTAVGLGSDDGKNQRFTAAGAQTKTPHSSGDGRGEHLVDHDAPALLRVLHCENRTIGQEADRDPGLVAHPQETTIALTMRPHPPVR